MRKIIFFTVVLFLVSTGIHSQNDDYVISQKNDTIYGSFSSLSTKFTSNDKKIKIKVDPNKYKGYYLDFSEESYESVDSPYPGEDRIFLHIIASGKINLYIHISSSSSVMPMGGGMVFGGTKINGVQVGGMPMSNTTFNIEVDYITSKNGARPEITFSNDIIPKKKYKEAVRNLIYDDKELVKELDSLKGSTKNLIYIIEEYNAKNNNQKTEKTFNYIAKDTIIKVNSCSEQIYSVKDYDLKKAVGKLVEPDINPVFHGSVKNSLKKFINENTFENIHNSELEFIIKVGFIVNCDGKAGNFINFTKSRNEPMLSYIENVNKIVNNMPDKWRAAEVNGHKVDSYQVLTFTIFKGELIGVSYE